MRIVRFQRLEDLSKQEVPLFGWVYENKIGHIEGNIFAQNFLLFPAGQGFRHRIEKRDRPDGMGLLYPKPIIDEIRGLEL